MRYKMAVLVTLAAAVAIAAPKSSESTPQPAPPGGPIEAFAAHEAGSDVRLRHNLWRRVLAAIVVDGAGGRRDIEYGQLSAMGHDVLDSYLTVMEGVQVADLNKNEQLAYWLNLYNAASLRLVYDAFDDLAARQGSTAGRNPLRPPSLKVKRIYLGKKNPWAEKRFTVSGQSISLNDIEHRILYAQWDPMLVMYGLSCPARGCPSLPAEPFDGASVRAQLAQAARDFVARKDAADPKRSKVELSELYEWHQSILGGQQAILEHVRSLAGGQLAAEMAGVTQISGYEFSWRLNGKQPPLDYKMPQGTMSRGVSPTSTF